VIVAEALEGAFTVAGLTVHAGGSVKVVGMTWQLRLTVPVNPLTDPTVTVADEVPSGGIATGENSDACRVKVCADAEIGRLNSAANRQRAARPARVPRRMNVCGAVADAISDVVSNCEVSDFEVSDFNMSRVRFKYLRFPGQAKGCPAADKLSIASPARRTHAKRRKSALYFTADISPRATGHSSPESLSRNLPYYHHAEADPLWGSRAKRNGRLLCAETAVSS
jgi:hypothetical protein